MSNVTINQLPTASTIDATADILPIYTASGAATQGISRKTLLGITGAPVGTTDSQSLTTKTLGNTNTVTLKDTLFTLQDDGDTSKQAKFQLSGITASTTRTYTLPDTSDTLVTLAATQTLTNKTLTSPTITSPTITNATISADTLSGFAASTNGTVYGISVTSGTIGSAALAANSVTSSAIATNAVAAAALATNAITLGYTAITSTITTTATSVVAATGLTQAATIPAGGRKVKITVQLPEVESSSATIKRVYTSIWDGTVGSGTQLTTGVQVIYSTGAIGNTMTMIAVVTPSAGAKTYNVGWYTDSATTASIICSATSSAFILVEAI